MEVQLEVVVVAQVKRDKNLDLGGQWALLAVRGTKQCQPLSLSDLLLWPLGAE